MEIYLLSSTFSIKIHVGFNLNIILTRMQHTKTDVQMKFSNLIKKHNFHVKFVLQIVFVFRFQL